MRKTPETTPDPGASRFAALVPWITEAQVRLYQPMLIPLGMTLLMMLFANIAVTLKTPAMPQPWRNWRRGYPPDNPMPALPANHEITAERYEFNHRLVGRGPARPPKPAGSAIELRPNGSRRFVLDDDAIEWVEGRR